MPKCRAPSSRLSAMRWAWSVPTGRMSGTCTTRIPAARAAMVPGVAVLEHEAMGRVGVQHRRRIEEQVGRGLGRGHQIPPEDARRAEVMVDSRGPQMALRGFGARIGGDGDGRSGVAQVVEQVARPGPERDAPPVSRQHMPAPDPVKQTDIEGRPEGVLQDPVTFVVHDADHSDQHILALGVAQLAQRHHRRPDHQPFAVDQGSVHVKDHRPDVGHSPVPASVSVRIGASRAAHCACWAGVAMRSLRNSISTLGRWCDRACRSMLSPGRCPR
jgi:hypothetical protein